MSRAAWPVALAGLLVCTACGDDGPRARPSDTSAATSTVTPPTTGSPTEPAPATVVATSVAAPTTERAPTTTSEPKVELPEGELVAVPLQNREDPPNNRFQVKLVNGTSERMQVDTIQFVWEGLTTEVVTRTPPTFVVGGQRIDLPLPLPAASCAGDGTRATMPPLNDARVVLGLADGTPREVPVVDQWHVARKLYEQDCERQFVESMVAIEWVGLHEEQFEGRPVTVADLRVTRRGAVGAIAVLDVSPTVPFTVHPVLTEPGETVVTLDAGAATASVPVRFVESRCDPHALAEIKQPTNFVAQVQFADGTVHPFVVYPDRDLWDDMRRTADAACIALGKVEFLGDSSDG
ncbi:MAG TPA: hypothetical protein VNQ73_03335 [Ilumatobacter sp.]|nr:hypothetical protein [Ilumatobacter sp.]